MIFLARTCVQVLIKTLSMSIRPYQYSHSLQEYAGDSCSTGMKEGSAVTVCRHHCMTDRCNTAQVERGVKWMVWVAVFMCCKVAEM